MEATSVSNDAIMQKKSNTKYFYLVAGEPSGDVIGVYNNIFTSYKYKHRE
jgi:hypothetical protein